MNYKHKICFVFMLISLTASADAMHRKIKPCLVDLCLRCLCIDPKTAKDTLNEVSSGNESTTIMLENIQKQTNKIHCQATPQEEKDSSAEKE